MIEKYKRLLQMREFSVLSNIVYIIAIIWGSYYAYKHHYLSKSGGIAAIFVGIAITIGFGGSGLFLLFAFFISSSLLSKYKKHSKRIMEEKTSKGNSRDYLQVIANGGLASISAILFFFTSETIWILIFSTFLAAANSDTWASEIGSLSKRKPFSLKTFKVTTTGTSGAISLLGTFASIIGSLFIAALTYIIFPISFVEFSMIALLGFMGSCIDTILGAYIQVEYMCKQCKKVYEIPKICHDKTVRIKGYTLFNNDVVNLLSGLLAGLLGFILFH